MPSVATLFLGFFLVSVLILFLIVCANLPKVFRSAHHYFRLFLARRSRSARMLADPEKLDADSQMLQGLFILRDQPVEEVAPSMETSH